MSNIRTSIRNNRKLILFLGVLFIIGIVFGIIYYLKQTNSIKDVLNNELSNLNEIIKNNQNINILNNLLPIFLIFISGFTIIGPILALFYLFYEGMSCGFLISILIGYKGVVGFLYSLIFYAITKFILIVILFYTIIITLKISGKLISCLIYKKDSLTYKFIKNTFLKIIIVIVSLIINNALIYYVGTKILNLFIFLI